MYLNADRRQSGTEYSTITVITNNPITVTNKKCSE